MMIDNSFWHSYTYVNYKGCLAQYSYFDNTLYVFKDISIKRLKDPNAKGHIYYSKKIVFISNAQLKEMYSPQFDLVKETVLDGKRGTMYKGKTTCGSYFFCLRQGEQLPVPRKSH